MAQIIASILCKHKQIEASPQPTAAYNYKTEELRIIFSLKHDLKAILDCFPLRPITLKINYMRLQDNSEHF